MAPTSEESQPLLTPKPRSVTVESDVDNQLIASTKRRATVVLPLVVITYFLGYYAAVVILNPYLYDLVSEEYNFKRNSSSQKPCVAVHGNNTNTTEKQIQEAIQKKVATIELYISLPSFVCAALSILMVGPITDKFGRKIGFLFPILGTFLKQAIYAAVVGLKLSPLVLIAGHICEALGGSFAAMLTSMFTVVSDVTVPGPQRSFRITVMEAVQTLTGAGIGSIVAQWIKVSYLYPLVFSMVASIVSLGFTLFLLPETRQVHGLLAPAAAIYPDCCMRLRVCVCTVLTSCLKKFKRSFSLFINDPCDNHGLAKRRLCLLVFILTVAVNFSTPGVQTLYLMKYPRCWPFPWILSFGSIQLVCNWVAILLLLGLMQKVFKMADRHIAIIGVVSSLTSAVFMSVAVNDTMIYEVAVLGIMIRVIIPMMRSVMSSVVNGADQGAVYASMGCVEILGAAVCGIITNRVYYATLSTWDGSVFVMFAALMVVALVLLIILNILFLKDQERENESTHNLPNGNIQEALDSSW